MGAPPPILIPIRLLSSFTIVTHPLVTIIPLQQKQIYFNVLGPILFLLPQGTIILQLTFKTLITLHPLLPPFCQYQPVFSNTCNESNPWYLHSYNFMLVTFPLIYLRWLNTKYLLYSKCLSLYKFDEFLDYQIIISVYCQY